MPKQQELNFKKMRDRENKQYLVTNYCLIQKLGIDYWEQLKFQKLKKIISQMDLDIIYK